MTTPPNPQGEPPARGPTEGSPHEQPSPEPTTPHSASPPAGAQAGPGYSASTRPPSTPGHAGESGSGSGWGQGPPPSSGLGAQQPHPGGAQGARVPGQKGFFAALFDFSFREYVTPRIVSIFYILVMVMLGLGWIVSTIISFNIATSLGVLTMLLFGPLIILFGLLFTRVGLEMYLSVIRIAQDTQDMRFRNQR